MRININKREVFSLKTQGGSNVCLRCTHLSVECWGKRITTHAGKVFTQAAYIFTPYRLEAKIPNAPRLLGTLTSLSKEPVALSFMPLVSHDPEKYILHKIFCCCLMKQVDFNVSFLLLYWLVIVRWLKTEGLAYHIG